LWAGTFSHDHIRTADGALAAANGGARRHSDADQHTHPSDRDARKHSDVDRHPHTTDSHAYTADTNSSATY
jgi:hypothetical protein